MAAVAILKSVSVTLSALKAAVGDTIKNLPTRVKGLGLSPKAGDSFVVKKGTEPVLTTVDGTYPLKQSGSEFQYAPGAYWSIQGSLVSEDGRILDEHYQLPLAVLYRTGKEYPSLGDRFQPENGNEVANRSGRELLADLFAQYPDSAILYKQEDELKKVAFLNAAESGYTISFQEEVEIYVLPPRTKAFRDGLGRRWGSLASDWRKSTAYGVEIRREQAPASTTTRRTTNSRKKSK